MEDSYKANKYLLSASITLLLFAFINIFKTAFPAFSATLNFYPPVGPLLGVYILSIIIYLISLGIFTAVKINSQKSVFWFFVFSAIAFLLLVFPPIFEPIAHLLGQ